MSDKLASDVEMIAGFLQLLYWKDFGDKTYKRAPILSSGKLKYNLEGVYEDRIVKITFKIILNSLNAVIDG